MIVDTLTELIGKTPLLKLSKINKQLDAEIYKREFLNPSGSVKDRAALSMIAAEKDGRLDHDTVVIEPTSNTGIALVYICAIKGYRLIITMPDSMSMERRNMLLALGAELDLTPGHLQMKGAIARAEQLAKSLKKSLFLNNFQTQPILLCIIKRQAWKFGMTWDLNAMFLLRLLEPVERFQVFQNI